MIRNIYRNDSQYCCVYLKKIPLLFAFLTALTMIASVAVIVSTDSSADNEATASDFIIQGTTVFRVDNTGELVWYKDFKRVDLDKVESVLVVSDGFILIGRTIAKTDFAGTVLWKKAPSLFSLGSGFVSGAALSDGFVVVGTSNGSGYKEGNTTWSTSIGTMAKYSYAGKELWKKNTKWGGDDEEYTSAIATEGGFLTIGSSFKITSTQNYYKNGIWSYYLTKYTEDGEQVWQNYYSEGIVRAMPVSDGVVIVSGPYPINNKSIEKCDSTGALVWKKNLDLGWIDSATAVQDGFIIGGSIEVDTSYKEGNTHYYQSENRPTVVKLNLNGDIQWKKSTNDGSGSLYAVAVVPDGFVAVGSVRLSDGTKWDDVQGKGSWDGAIIKFNNKGDLLWKKIFGGAGSDSFKEISLIPNGFIVTGTSDKNSFGNGDWSEAESKTYYNKILVKFDNSGAVEEALNIDAGDADIDGYFDGLLSSLKIMTWIFVGGLIAVVCFVIFLIYTLGRSNKKLMKRETN